MRFARLGPLVLALSTLGAARAEPAEEAPADADSIPVVGRPADLPFSEASGRFEVSARAAPTTLEALTPLNFTVAVRPLGRVRRPPRRIDLRQVPAFAEHFHIEKVPESSSAPDEKGPWEFVYRLKPRDTRVTEVPGFPFVFFDPDIPPADKRFQVIYTDPIPIRVGRREVLAVPLAAPEWALELATGPGLLARETPWRPPGPAALAALLLGPALPAAFWYALWRRLRPDAARLARRRRSRAARQALAALEGVRRQAPERGAERVAAAVADYLRQRFDLSAAEPTPAEAEAHLGGRGCPLELAARVGAFFRACDGTRFGPSHGPGRADQAEALVRSAFDLLHALEERSPPEHSPVSTLLSAVLLLSPGVPPGLSEAELAARAEKEFVAGVQLRDARDEARPHFRSAAEHLQELRARGVRNALLFRDLGNAYLCGDELPRAILAYRQGLRVAPGDRALRNNLRRARELVVLPPGSTLGRPPAEGRPQWLPEAGPGWPFAGALGFYFLAWGLLTRWLMVRRGRLLAGALGTLAGAVLLAAAALALTRADEGLTATPLVVVADDGVLLRKGNGLAYPPRYETPLPRGAEARLLFERDGWLQIELAGGEVGWIPRAYALVSEG